MNRIESKDLRGANAYFTNFDNRIVKSATDLETLERSIERNLKVLLLTKNNIVCAASHLVNPITYKLLSSNPILLKEAMIIPAFRKDKENISELFEKKEINKERKIKYIEFYDESISKTVLWELQENSTWFRDTFIQGLSSENSVIRRNLKHLKKREIEDLLLKIKDYKILDRGTIDQLTLHFDMHSQTILRNYRELVYHMSGARVVNCESTLPQENYIDYSFTDLKKQRTQLSELQIFWKIYIELILEILNRYKLPIDALDSLSFEDIHSLRQPILNSNFIEKYNHLITLSSDSISKEKDERSDILYNAQELMRIREELEHHYKEIFQEQLPSFFSKESTRYSQKLLKNSISFGMGLIPLPAPVSTGLSFIENIRATHFNFNQYLANRRAISDFNYYIQHKEYLLNTYIKSFNIREGSEMIDLIKLIQYTLSQKSTI